ncbi:MAG: hypothetical protein B1H02_05355 [Candidatus Latescibacteria bacterium 4484_107]|nr:MAG: hypothetical protein B1H02_05355 [Candidatus Latescibacteria bacterium 4484_107]
MSRWSFCIALALLTFGATIEGATPAEKIQTGVPTWAPTAIADSWETAEGDSLVIDRKGAARFVDRDGKTVVSAQVQVRSWEPATDLGLSFESVVTLAFAVGDTTYVVPGCFFAGEGDPSRLELYMVPSQLSFRLAREWGLGSGRVVRFRGTPP